MKKRLLASLLALCLMLGLLPPGTAWASDDGFTIENGVLTKYTGVGGDVIIPDGVTRIGDTVFRNRGDLTSVTIPRSVTFIGNMAFKGCTGLTSVTIPDTVEVLGGEAFDGCTGLTSFTIPNSITVFLGSVIANCSRLSRIQVSPDHPAYVSVDGVLFSKDKTKLVAYPGGKQGAYVIPGSVTRIEHSAFTGCAGLSGVSIPSSVVSIDNYAFSGCTGLTDVTIPDGVRTINAGAFKGCTGLTNIKIPNSVNRIDNFTFEGCASLASMTIPYGVASIGQNAFLKCSGLTSVTIPDSVTSIESSAFESCTKLANLTLSSNLTSVGYSVFASCRSLTSVTIPNGVKSIGYRAFYSCERLTSVTIPDSVESIDQQAFCFCSNLADVYYDGSQAQWDAISIGNYNDPLTSAALHCKESPGSTIIEQGAYGENLTWTLYDTGTLVLSGSGPMADYTADSYIPWYNLRAAIKAVSFAGDITTIGDHAFDGCTGLTSITIPGSVTSIGWAAFYGCKGLTSVTIPNSVTSIETYAFYLCSKLTSITIPASVTSIGDGVFWSCSGLTEILVDPGNRNYASADGVLFDRSMDTLLQFPNGKQGVYSIPAGVTSIGQFAFSYCKGLTGITIPNSVTSIGDAAFMSCGLTSVAIPNSVTSIGQNTFRHCSELTSVTLPDSITSIAAYAFDDCGALTDVYYGGTRAQWETIKIETANEPLTDAAIYYTGKVKWQYFDFANAGEDFFNPEETRNYYAGDYFDHFNTVLSSFYGPARTGYYMSKLRAKQSSKWEGSCYGFAAVEGMVNQNLLPIAAIQTGVDRLSSVYPPRMNQNARNLLNYYYLTQFVPELRSEQYSLTTSTGRAALLRTAKAVAGGTPHMFSYFFSEGGHAIILEDGSPLPDGGWELHGQDNRFHGYTVCEKSGGRWVDTGKPVTVSVHVSADAASCTVSLSENTYFMRGGAVYYLPQGLRESVTDFEPVSIFSHFASADPTGTAASALPCGESADTSSILYYEPDGAAAGSFEIKDRDNQVVLSSNAHTDTNADWWYTIGGAPTICGTQAGGVTALSVQSAPTGVMAKLNNTDNREYTVSGLGGGTVSYVGQDAFLSVSAASGGTAIIDAKDSSIILQGAKGDFSITVTNTNGTASTVSGQGDGGNIEVNSTPNGSLSLAAPKGNYDVAFVGTDNRVISTVVTSTGGSVSVNVPVQQEPVVCGKYRDRFHAGMKWSGNDFALTLTSTDESAVPGTIAAWQAVYDGHGKMISLEKLSIARLSDTKVRFSGTASSEMDCALFVVDADFAPVIGKFSLGNH